MDKEFLILACGVPILSILTLCVYRSNKGVQISLFLATSLLLLFMWFLSSFKLHGTQFFTEDRDRTMDSIVPLTLTRLSAHATDTVLLAFRDYSLFTTNLPPGHPKRLRAYHAILMRLNPQPLENNHSQPSH